MSNTCPKCGADYNGRPAANQHDYWCGSTTWGEGDYYQSPECVRRERDQLVERNRELVERIKRLEEAGGAMLRYYDASSRFNWKWQRKREREKQAKETKS